MNSEKDMADGSLTISMVQARTFRAALSVRRAKLSTPATMA